MNTNVALLACCATPTTCNDEFLRLLIESLIGFSNPTTDRINSIQSRLHADPGNFLADIFCTTSVWILWDDGGTSESLLDTVMDN